MQRCTAATCGTLHGAAITLPFVAGRGRPQVARRAVITPSRHCVAGRRRVGVAARRVASRPPYSMAMTMASHHTPDDRGLLPSPSATAVAVCCRGHGRRAGRAYLWHGNWRRRRHAIQSGGVAREHGLAWQALWARTGVSVTLVRVTCPHDRLASPRAHTTQSWRLRTLVLNLSRLDMVAYPVEQRTTVGVATSAVVGSSGDENR